jgi:chitinase
MAVAQVRATNKLWLRETITGCILALAALAAAQPSPEFVVSGYVYPLNSLLTPSQIDARGLTRITYAFAAIQNGRLTIGSPVDAQNLVLLAGRRKQNPSLRVLVSVGGWLGSGEFSDAALTSQSRKVFVDSAVDFLRRYNLDGLDVDWEYPGMPGAGQAFRPEDKSNFTLLLKDLRTRFDQEDQATGRKLVLTIAAGASADYLVHTEMDKVQAYVDAVNLMAYDYAMASISATTGHSAPLFADPAAPDQDSVDVSVRAFENAGVPSGKIILGVPFFGHLWGKVADRNHGLFQPGKPVHGDFAAFGAIQQDMLGHGFVRYWDETADAPYLYSAERKEFVSYEDAESLTAKCVYVKKHKLGGVMIWQYLDDPSGVLLQTINRALGESSSSKQ